jgi:branched-chain amino acid transport system ATP-binding protein
MAAQARLSVRNVKKSYGGVKAVDDVSFDVFPGEMVAMIGPNGAGKSTCFNALSGQVTADSGKILFEGRDITKIGSSLVWRRGIGRTFQITATFSSMTVLENVQMVLQSHHAGVFSFIRGFRESCRADAEALLDSVEMKSQAGRRCAVLAYGDLKRLELAMALANNPRLLLMDEPTAGMSPSERIQLMALTRNLVIQRGISVLFTEHDMDVVFGKADRIIVLNRGRLIAQGAPALVREDPEVREVYLGGGRTYGAETA